MAADLEIPIRTDEDVGKLKEGLSLMVDAYLGAIPSVLEAYSRRADALRGIGCAAAANKADAEAMVAGELLKWNCGVLAQFFADATFEPLMNSSGPGNWLAPGEGGRDDEAGSVTDPILHVIISMMRDWSDASVGIRDVVLDPVTLRLVRAIKASTSVEVSLARIWVPGCGMGRLAMELLANLGCTVVASDESVAMLASFAQFLRWQRCHIHPAAGCMSAAVDGDHGRSRKDEIQLPVKMRNALKAAVNDCRLELELRSISCADKRKAEFDAIGTLFVLSKVPDLPNVVGALAAALKPGGVWVNCGPLQAHHSSPAVGFTFEELIALAEAKGFQVIEDQRFEHVDYIPRETQRGSRDVFDVQLLVAKKVL
eukprot:TRINITY_DN27216_c0_g1_i1.p1 TRINITY_DN27216_c0_g1~~TRINITY_DN27216_c0_g1_i1.p1  ORF type:complete len:370 (+),score=80.95 TRINITY_DN27216_c0_g1_i1:58-1167(+)